MLSYNLMYPLVFVLSVVVGYSSFNIIFRYEIKREIKKKGFYDCGFRKYIITKVERVPET